MLSAIHPILQVDRSSTASVLERAYAVNAGMSADPVRFSSPNPPLPEFQGQIAKLEESEKQTRSQQRGAARVRNLERDRLVAMLDSQRGYVKTLCDASPEEASVIIQAAGFVGTARRAYTKPMLEVTRGAASGAVDLAASVRLLMGGSSRRNKVFHWQWTTDGGKSFTDAPATATSTATITGLPSLTVVGFRVKVSTATSAGEWSPIVSIVVH